MKKFSIFSFILAFVIMFTLPVTNASAASFKDVDSRFWASPEINEFVDGEILSGYNDRTFRPNQPISRADAAILIARALKLETKDANVLYKDIKKNHYAYNAIAAVTNANIMTGNENKFQPNKGLTRAEMAVVIANAFNFESSQTSSFSDVKNTHFAYKAINSLKTHNISKGYEDRTFKPNKVTTRAEFVVLLSKAMKTNDLLILESNKDTELIKQLKEAYKNEISLNSYEFSGDMNLGILLAGLDNLAPEEKAMLKMLEDIKVSMTGVYKLDPMQLEMNLKLTLQGDVETTLNMPIIMTEEKMWMKLPNSPLLPLPQEVQGKFIEFDLNEMMATDPSLGVPMMTPTAMNFDQQMELSALLNDIIVDEFGAFYSEVPLETITLPDNIAAAKVIKFELSNKYVEAFIQKAFTGVLPQFMNVLATPAYAESLGLTPEDLAMAQSLFTENEEMVSMAINELRKIVKINDLSQYIVLNDKNQIVYTAANLDLSFTMDQETFGFKFNTNMLKTKMNESVQFKLGIPTGDAVVPYEKLLQLEQTEVVPQ